MPERCLLCGGISFRMAHRPLPDFKYGVSGSWPFFECVTCGLAVLDAGPQDAGRAYPPEYSQHSPVRRCDEPSARGAFSSSKEHIRRALLSRKGYGGRSSGAAQAFCGWICSRISRCVLGAQYGFLLFPPARPLGFLLDVGCGNGRFLSRMASLGWNAYGIEPDDASRAIAAADPSVRIFSSWEEASFQEGFFDVIVMNHSLEHMGDPQGILKKCRRALAPDGIIGICVPNWASLSHRAFGRYCYHLEPPRHAVMYAPRTLSLMLRRCDFKVIESGTTSIREGDIAFRSGMSFRFRRQPTFCERWLWRCVARSMIYLDPDSGEEVFAWARKD